MIEKIYLFLLPGVIYDFIFSILIKFNILKLLGADKHGVVMLKNFFFIL